MQFVHSFTSGVAGLRNFTFAVQDHVPHHQEILPIAIDGIIRCTTNRQTDRPLEQYNDDGFRHLQRSCIKSPNKPSTC